MSERARERRPDADDERAAESPAADASLSAAEQAAGAMGNQAFLRALEATREAQLGAGPAAAGPATPTAAGQAAQGVWDILSQTRPAAEGAAEAAVEGAQEGAAIDKAALTGRVVGIARDALGSWTATSAIFGVTINGPIGAGGTLIGAPLRMFMQYAAAAPPAEAAVQAKALSGFADAFQHWCTLFQIPGMPLWPSFTAVPAPEAPPTVGIALPLAALAPAPLSLTLVGSDEHEQEALDAVAMELRTAFETWKAGRIVKGLIGHGPVPTFSPPVIPAGPVVDGTGFAPPPAI